MSILWSLFSGFLSGLFLFWPTVLCLYVFYFVASIGNKGDRLPRTGYWRLQNVFRTTYVLHLLACGFLLVFSLVVRNPVFEQVVENPIPLALGLAAGTWVMYRIVRRR